MLEWLREQLGKADKSLKARQEMGKVWRSGNSKSWLAVGCKLNKAQRLKTADMHARISLKVARDVEMIKALIAELEPLASARR